jgi:thymidylate kinase
MATAAPGHVESLLLSRACDALRAARVPFCFMRGNSLAAAMRGGGDLDLLVDRRRAKDADRALAGAGFVLRAGARPPWKAVYVACQAGVFATLDLHFELVQGWLVFGEAREVLARASWGGVPHPRDLAEMLAGHALLGKRRLSPERLEVVGAWLPAVAAALACEDGPARAAVARTLRRRALGSRFLGRSLAALLRAFANRVGLAPRPAVVALLGPDGAGKTTLVARLCARLAATPIAPRTAYMGCWGGYRLPLGRISRLAPHEPPPPAESPPKRLTRALKGAAFFALLSAELLARYLASVRRARAPLVLCDRWIEDVRVDNGVRPVALGPFGRALLRLFPRPDLVLYVERDAEEGCAAKPDLTPAEYRRNDRAYREAIAGRLPAARIAAVPVDAPAETLAARVVERHWRVLAGGKGGFA